MKYVLDGIPAGSGMQAKGYLFPWRTGQISGVDPTNARVEILPDLASDDICFGFYSYEECDLIYTALDINPFSNPAVKDSVIFFFQKSQFSVDPTHTIYHEIRDVNGNVISTNDPSPTTGARNYFGSVVVGFSVGVNQFQFKDARSRGGGLAPQYQDNPSSSSLWDLGFWDGKPYPVGGCVVVMLPASLLNTFNRDQVNDRLQSILPVGVLPVVRYYDTQGNETS